MLLLLYICEIVVLYWCTEGNVLTILVFLALLLVDFAAKWRQWLLATRQRHVCLDKTSSLEYYHLGTDLHEYHYHIYSGIPSAAEHI